MATLQRKEPMSEASQFLIYQSESGRTKLDVRLVSIFVAPFPSSKNQPPLSSVPPNARRTRSSKPTNGRASSAMKAAP